MVMLEGSISTSDLGSSSNNGTTGGQKRKRVKRESSSHASMTKMIDGSGNAQPSPSAELEQQLMPTAAECSKLASVIRM